MPRHYQQVCPTYVGMNRNLNPGPKRKECMPHVCGDEPGFFSFCQVSDQYAPRMWG